MPDAAAELQSLLEFLYECPVGLVSFADDGTIRRINPAAVSLLSGVVEELSISNVFDTLRPVWPELDDLVRGAGPSGPVGTARRLACRPAPGGGRRWLSATVDRVTENRNMLTVTDVTATAAVESTLLDSERNLQAVFDTIDEGFCVAQIVVDDSGRAVDYRFLKVNPLFVEMTGLADPVGKTALELVPGLEQSWVDTYASVALGGETLRFEHGSEAMGRWFDVFTAPIEPRGHFVIVFKDQTQRRLAERALRTAAAADAFRAGLTDALRATVQPADAHASAARLLGEFLGDVRVRYAALSDDGDTATVTTEHDLASSPPVPDQLRLDRVASALAPGLRRGRTVVVADAATDERLTADERATTTSFGVHAYVAVPVVRQGRARSVLVVDRPAPHAWTADEIGIVEEVAERTSAAAERARNELELRVRHDRAALVADLLAELERCSTVEAQAQRLADLLVPGFADYAVVEAPSRSEPVLGIAHRHVDGLATLRELRRHHRLQPGNEHSVARAAAGEGQFLSRLDAASRAEYATEPDTAVLLDKLGPRAHIAVPLDLGGGERGALMVGLTEPDERVFTASDLDFLKEAAARVGAVMGATRLRQEEHLVAVRLQQALLPDHTRWDPAVLIAARYSAASAFMDVGGDWYDTFRWPDGHLGLMVGDVVGHNLESAVTMGRLRAATAAIAGSSSASPAALLDDLDRFARGPDGTEFATAACVVVDPATGSLSYASAGHPPIIVVEPDGACRTLVGAQGPPLCAWPSGPRSQATTVLLPGSLVVMYSDGLVERRRKPLDDGFDRLRAACAMVRDEPIDAIANLLVDEMTAYAPPEDDVVVACFRYTPATATFRRTIAADATQLGPVRRALRDWFDGIGVLGSAQQDALLVVGEALANAIEHGSSNDPTKSVSLEISDHHGHYVSVRVSDSGHWRHPRSDTTRGRGLSIMSRLASHVTRTTGGDGSTVELAVPVRERNGSGRV